MKDYTKYDFPLIFNSSVYIEYTNIEGKKDCMSGILLTQTQNEICIQDDVNHESFWAIEKKTITHLSAKIKVEDMSAKQMMEFCFSEGDCNYVVLYNDKTCVSTCGKHAKNIELTDYIDCTEWGW